MLVLQRLLLLPLAMTLGLAASGHQAEKATAPPAAASAASDKDIAAAERPAYPLATCVACDKALAPGALREVVVAGRFYRLCCEACQATVAADPAAHAAKVEAAVVAAQKPSYPLATCAVSGEELGSMGDPIEHVAGTKLVRFCCKGCVGAFEKEPATYMAKVDAAWIAAQLPSYPLDTCIVMEGDPLSDEELGIEPIDYLYGTKLVRFCCKSCVKKFNKDPDAYLAKLAAASAAPAEAR